eukprot:Hpha_TRINITY_DN15305_c1_g1::TRINITY_DN15305_c1_g1_i2::g.90503::m.90503
MGTRQSVQRTGVYVWTCPLFYVVPKVGSLDQCCGTDIAHWGVSINGIFFEIGPEKSGPRKIKFYQRDVAEVNIGTWYHIKDLDGRDCVCQDFCETAHSVAKAFLSKPYNFVKHNCQHLVRDIICAVFGIDEWDATYYFRKAGVLGYPPIKKTPTPRVVRNEFAEQSWIFDHEFNNWEALT